MCFGGRKKRSDEPAPRPAPAPAQWTSSADGDPRDVKASNYTSHIQEPPSTSAAGPSSIPAPSPAPWDSQPAPPKPADTELPPSYANANNTTHHHDWQSAVPDTTLFPPPPAIFSGFERSPTSNATEEESSAGETWCARYPLTAPVVLDDASKGALHFNNIRLMEPTGFNGQLTWKGPGAWQVSTAMKSPDRCLISYPPLYVVNEHNPLHLGQPKTIYFEVKLLSDSPTQFVAMGFTALPYPSFRMPGWHRASLAVHGDDGHKYINDRWGGKEFTEPFRQGDTYGLGMTVKPTGGARPLVDVFFTCNGFLKGGWNIHEETDAEEDLPVTGLEGFHDLCAAVGTYQGVRLEIVFEPSQWEYRGL